MHTVCLFFSIFLDNLMSEDEIHELIINAKTPQSIKNLLKQQKAIELQHYQPKNDNDIKKKVSAMFKLKINKSEPKLQDVPKASRMCSIS